MQIVEGSLAFPNLPRDYAQHVWRPGEWLTCFICIIGTLRILQVIPLSVIFCKYGVREGYNNYNILNMHKVNFWGETKKEGKSVK